MQLRELTVEIRYFPNRFFIAEDSPQVTERLLTLMEEITIGGAQVHDANIVATMLVYGIGELLTNNVDDFNRFSELIAVVPLAVSPGSAIRTTRGTPQSNQCFYSYAIRSYTTLGRIS